MHHSSISPTGPSDEYSCVVQREQIPKTDRSISRNVSSSSALPAERIAPHGTRVWNIKNEPLVGFTKGADRYCRGSINPRRADLDARAKAIPGPTGLPISIKVKAHDYLPVKIIRFTPTFEYQIDSHLGVISLVQMKTTTGRNRRMFCNVLVSNQNFQILAVDIMFERPSKSTPARLRCTEAKRSKVCTDSRFGEIMKSWSSRPEMRDTETDRAPEAVNDEACGVRREGGN